MQSSTPARQGHDGQEDHQLGFSAMTQRATPEGQWLVVSKAPWGTAVGQAPNQWGVKAAARHVGTARLAPRYHQPGGTQRAPPSKNQGAAPGPRSTVELKTLIGLASRRP